MGFNGPLVFLICISVENFSENSSVLLRAGFRKPLKFKAESLKTQVLKQKMRSCVASVWTTPVRTAAAVFIVKYISLSCSGSCQQAVGTQRRKLQRG